jgi:hypothetical protein
MEGDVATGECPGMFQIRSVRAHNAVSPRHNTTGGGERHADVTDAADPAIRERDEVEDCQRRVISGQRSAELVERTVTSGGCARLPQSIRSAVHVPSIGAPAGRSCCREDRGSDRSGRPRIDLQRRAIGAADHNSEPLTSRNGP